MTFSEKIQKNLENNQIKQVIDEFRSLISECPASEKDAFNDANQLRSQVVVLAGRYNSINDKINLGTANPESANIEKTQIVNSFVQILNQMPDTYPDLNTFINNRDEEEAWKEAQKINSIEGYDKYFKKYPNGKYIAETHRLMKDLNEIKRTQEDEMKRVAQEEKERRDRETKIKEESRPPENSKADTKEQNISSRSELNNENLSKDKINPADSGSNKNKTLMYAGIGAAVLILLIFIMMRGDDKSDSVNLKNNLQDQTKNEQTNSEQTKTESTSSNSTEGNKLYFVQEYTDDGQEIGKSDNFTVNSQGGTITAMLRTAQPFGVLSVDVRVERETSVGSEIIETIPLDVNKEWDFLYFPRTFNDSGDYIVTVYKKDGTVIASGKVKIEMN